MANFTAVYYREPDGSEPVSAFLHELPPRARRRSATSSTGSTISATISRICRFRTQAKSPATCVSCVATSVRGTTA